MWQLKHYVTNQVGQILLIAMNHRRAAPRSVCRADAGRTILETHLPRSPSPLSHTRMVALACSLALWSGPIAQPAFREHEGFLRKSQVRITLIAEHRSNTLQQAINVDRFLQNVLGAELSRNNQQVSISGSA